MIGRDVALQVLWRKDAMLQQLTDLCVGRNLEAPVSRQETELLHIVTMDSHGMCTMFFRHDFGTPDLMIGI